MIKTYDPLSFIHQFLQHLPPKHFQRLRYYGLHSSVTYRRVKENLDEGLKREIETISLLFSILLAMLKGGLMLCESCGSTDFSKSEEVPDSEWLTQHVKSYAPKNKAPPKGTTYELDGAKNESFFDGEAMPVSIDKCGQTP